MEKIYEQLQAQIDELKERIDENIQRDLRYKIESSPLDTNMQEGFLLRTIADSISFTVTVSLVDTLPQTLANYGSFFVAPYPCVLIKAYERHGTAGSDASAVTLDIEKLASGTAKGSGTSMVATTFDLKGTANTPQLILPSTTIANRRLDRGEAVALKPTGTLTALKDVVVTLTFKTELKNLPI